MAFNTKIDLSDSKVYQATADTLSLSGSTNIGTAQYFTNKCATYTARSIPDVGFVTGKTAGLQSEISYISGVTDTKLPTQIFTGYTASTCNTIKHAITGATNGLTCYAAHNVCLGGALTNDTTIGNNTCTLSIKVATLDLTGSTAFNLSTCCALITTSDNKGLEYSTDYSGSFANNSLITKKYVCSQISGVTTGYLCCANNGLTKIGQNVVLGGALTGNTTVGSSTCTLKINVNTLSLSGNTAFNLSTSCGVITDTGNKGGLQYAADYCAFVVARSLVDAAYVTGKTNVIDTIGTIGQIIYRDSTHLVGCGNMIYCDALQSFAFGKTNIASGSESSSFGGSGNTATAVHSAIIGGKNNTIGSGNIDSVILGGSNISLTASTNCCVVAVPNLSIWCTPSGSGNLLTWDSGTKKVGVTSVGASGGVTGATNGLTKNGQNIGLGGCLCCTTSIIGNEALCLGISGNRLGSINLWSFDDTCMNARCLLMSSSGATYTDLTAVSKQGIKYAADYSLTYDSRSLVDKGYADSIATGLHIKAAVVAATTVPITLTANQTIDGVLTTTGMRILVKNQADATTNGIYSANTGGWGRTNDYNGVGIIGEVSNGDLIPVTSGNTQNSSIWALVTPDPIIVGSTNLNFTEFSTVIDVQGGQGICITQVGGTHTVCVDATSGCGLAVGVGGVCINNSIGGNGLTYSGGTINVNACSCGAVAAINVGYNCSDNLVVACSDITSMSAIVTGATNGLTKNGQNVGLGGCLCCNTLIDTCGYNFNICGLAFNPFFIKLCDSPHSIEINSCKCTSICSCGCEGGGLAISTSGNLSIGFKGTGIITDSTATPLGLQYASDVYRAHFTDCSLVDKGYVHSYVTGGTTVLTACNGLTKQINNNVVLGGALTGTTTIGNSTCTLKINVDILSLTGNTAFNLSTSCGVITDTGSNGGLKYAASYAASIVARSIPDAAWVTGCTNAIATNYICNAENGLHKRGNNYVSLGGSLTGNTTIGAGVYDLKINVVNLNLTGSTAINLTTPALTLQTTPPAGTTSDAVLVWNSVDKNIKTVSGAALGDKNNIYSHSAVTTSVLLTTGSSYVILVNNSAPVTITLPATPLNGQTFKIKNISGSAVTNIITVAGNTHNIDGSPTGLINTDYGALELMYDTTLTAWYSLAFIN